MIKKSLGIFTLLILLNSNLSFSQSDFKHEQIGIEDELSFNLLDDVAAKTNLLSEKDLVLNLRDYQIIFVRGIFTNFYQSILRTINHYGVPIDPTILNCFQDQFNYFNRLGIDFIDLKFDTEDIPDKAGEDIVKAIKKASKKVLLISHSKGGVDVLHGLINHPEVQNKVAGWLNLQAPINGSLVADYVVDKPYITLPVSIILSFLDGDQDVFETMTTNYRKEYFYNHKKDIEKLTNNIPVISFASTYSSSDEIQNDFLEGELTNFEGISLFFLFKPVLDYNVGVNDGLISISTTCLYGSNCLVGKGMDHSAPVMDIQPFKSYGTEKRLLLTRYLIQFLLSPSSSSFFN